MRPGIRRVTSLSAYVPRSRKLVDRILRTLSLVRKGETEQIDCMFDDLRRLKNASRGAGFKSISHLCQQMEGYLSTGLANHRVRMADLAPPLMAGCNYIRLHTAYLMRGFVPPDTPVSLRNEACLKEGDVFRQSETTVKLAGATRNNTGGEQPFE